MARCDCRTVTYWCITTDDMCGLCTSVSTSLHLHVLTFYMFYIWTLCRLVFPFIRFKYLTWYILLVPPPWPFQRTTKHLVLLFIYNLYTHFTCTIMVFKSKWFCTKGFHLRDVSHLPHFLRLPGSLAHVLAPGPHTVTFPLVPKPMYT